MTLLLAFVLLEASSQSKISYIKMQRTACFGRCPEYTVELFIKGNMTYVGKKNVERIGTSTARISNTAMTRFMKEISKYKLSTLSATYKPKAADLPRLNFTFVINGKTKSIKNGESGPFYLAAIGKKIDSLLAESEWEEVASTSSDEPGGPVLNMEVKKDRSILMHTEQQPEFPGGMDAMMEFLNKNLRYPNQAKENNIQGKVICGFTITEQGKIEDVTVQRGIGGGCDEEAVRVIKMMPYWKPAKQNGKAVNVHYNIPIAFKLD